MGIKGVGRRYANVVLKKADIDVSKRAGELSEEEVEKLITIMANPRQYKIPDWFLNRQKDIKDGKFSQVTSNMLENKLREDLERLKKIRAHRGLRHYWGLRVRGQHTKTTGRLDAQSVYRRRSKVNPVIWSFSWYAVGNETINPWEVPVAKKKKKKKKKPREVPVGKKKKKKKKKS